jgi:hypothetical protein
MWNPKCAISFSFDTNFRLIAPKVTVGHNFLNLNPEERIVSP